MNDQLFALDLQKIQIRIARAHVLSRPIFNHSRAEALEELDEAREYITTLEELIESNINGVDNTLYSQSVHLLKLPKRVYTALAEANIVYIGQLVRMTLSEMQSIYNIGKDGLMLITDALAANDFKIGDVKSNWVIPNSVSEIGTWVFNKVDQIELRRYDVVFLKDIVLQLEKNQHNFKVTIGPAFMDDRDLQGIYILLNGETNVNYNDVRTFKLEWEKALKDVDANCNEAARKLFQHRRVPCEFSPNSILDKPLDFLELSVKTVNCLEAEGFRYVGQIVQNNKRSLLKCPNLGWESFQEIVQALKRRKLKLDPDVEWGFEED